MSSREQFEAWFKSDFHPDKTGPYLKETLFFAWQAASKASEQQLAAVVAENAGLKDGALQEIEVINRGGQAYCVKDGMSVNPIYARGWNDYRAKSLSVETPATDAYLAEVRAHGVDALNIQFKKCSGMLYADSVIETAAEFAAQLRQGAAL